MFLNRHSLELCHRPNNEHNPRKMFFFYKWKTLHAHYHGWFYGVKSLSFLLFPFFKAFYFLLFRSNLYFPASWLDNYFIICILFGCNGIVYKQNWISYQWRVAQKHTIRVLLLKRILLDFSPIEINVWDEHNRWAFMCVSLISSDARSIYSFGYLTGSPFQVFSCMQKTAIRQGLSRLNWSTFRLTWLLEAILCFKCFWWYSCTDYHWWLHDLLTQKFIDF